MDAATQLAHALAAAIARELGVRALSLKGPIAAHYELRAPRASADADVLIEPERFTEYCAALESRGWHTRVGRETPALIPQHSMTYIHADWPCDIDVHWMFPGFFADAADAFDILWSSRQEVSVAHVPVQAPSKAGSAVIMALHAERDRRSPKHLEERELVSVALREAFTTSERDEFTTIARAGRAAWTLRDYFVLADLGPVVVDADAEQQRRWALFSTRVDDASSVAWWHHVRAAPWSQKPRWIVRAIWVSRADMPRNDREDLPSRREMWDYQIHRWRRGAEATLRYFLGKR
ncbi:nucleotidyltransferase family protein [Microbacterium sp. Au-Mic1]|uniref:nucleotidyltransferase family protein n=1 Tax=Microbacterium sp. Au-Mic1 TaxID=2906457 RepID=UPI001E4B0B1A|nr:nucleotidyltransferase family protein [Microbacterium sp. Au-Mic1]MCE4027324.1 nucleotidyltransferase family protein [Microbacterium sp. Au-Mic1]